MAVTIRIPDSVAADLPTHTLALKDTPSDLGALIAALEARHPGIAQKLNSSAVNAAVNGDVVLHGRDRTPLKDGDEIEFLVMFAGG